MRLQPSQVVHRNLVGPISLPESVVISIIDDAYQLRHFLSKRM
jgi:hypothetical protein